MVPRLTMVAGVCRYDAEPATPGGLAMGGVHSLLIDSKSAIPPLRYLALLTRDFCAKKPPGLSHLHQNTMDIS